MEKYIEIEKSNDKFDNCNTCHGYENVYRLKFHLNPSSTVIRLCDTCMKRLETEIGLAIRY